MSADELRALIAAAAPGARVTITVVTVELPGARAAGAGAATAPPTPSPEDSALPRPRTALDPLLPALAPALLERSDPFTCAELAAVLRVAPDTIAAWARAGLLPGAARLAGVGWRIPPQAVLAMHAQHAAQHAGRARGTDAGGAPPAAAPPPDVHAQISSGTAASPSAGGAGGAPGAAPAEFDVASLAAWRKRRAGGA